MPEQPIHGFFVALPITTLRAKEWQNLQATSRCVYHTMMIRYNRRGKEANGKVNWTQEELAKETGFSVRTIKRATKELTGAEFITVENPGGRWASGTTYEVNPLYANGRNPRAT